MRKTQLQNWFVLTSPVILLSLTRIVIELVTQWFNPIISWIPAFIGYYMVIILIIVIAKKVFLMPIRDIFTLSLKPVPKFRLLFWTIFIPALLPLGVIVAYYNVVPPIFYFYILFFAVINSFFEEHYWRGFLFFLPGNHVFRMVYSAALFSFSHFVFWGYWYKSPIIMIPTLVSTLVMGFFYMYFMIKKKNLLYPILAHFIVDIFNLSVAVYSGLITPHSF